MKILKLDKLPECYGMQMAQDLNNNDALRKYWNDAMEASDYQEKIGQLPLGPVLQEITMPFLNLTFKGIMGEVEKELDRKRGLDVPCKDCHLRGGCIITALVLMADEGNWF